MCPWAGRTKGEKGDKGKGDKVGSLTPSPKRQQQIGRNQCAGHRSFLLSGACCNVNRKGGDVSTPGIECITVSTCMVHPGTVHANSQYKYETVVGSLRRALRLSRVAICPAVGTCRSALPSHQRSARRTATARLWGAPCQNKCGHCSFISHRYFPSPSSSYSPSPLWPTLGRYRSRSGELAVPPHYFTARIAPCTPSGGRLP